VVIDDCWQGQRDAQGNTRSDPTRFPSGIEALTGYIHACTRSNHVAQCSARASAHIETGLALDGVMVRRCRRFKPRGCRMQRMPQPVDDYADLRTKSMH